jgi:hypothetical protein
MVFDGVNDLVKWAQWIAPAHQLVFDRLAYANDAGGAKLDKATLVKRFFARETCATLDDLFYGRFGKKVPDEPPEIQLNDQERQPSLPSLLRHAAELTNLAKMCAPRDHCAVCDCLEEMSEEQLAHRSSITPDANLCPACLVLKLKDARKSDRSTRRGRRRARRRSRTISSRRSGRSSSHLVTTARRRRTSHAW